MQQHQSSIAKLTSFIVAAPKLITLKSFSFRLKRKTPFEKLQNFIKKSATRISEHATSRQEKFRSILKSRIENHRLVDPNAASFANMSLDMSVNTHHVTNRSQMNFEITMDRDNSIELRQEQLSAVMEHNFEMEETESLSTDKRPLLKKLSGFFTGAPKSIKEKHNKVIQNLRNKLMIITEPQKSGIPITHEPTPLIQEDSDVNADVNGQQSDRQGSLDMKNERQLSIDVINHDPSPRDQVLKNEEYEVQEQNSHPIEVEQPIENVEDQQLLNQPYNEGIKNEEYEVQEQNTNPIEVQQPIEEVENQQSPSQQDEQKSVEKSKIDQEDKEVTDRQLEMDSQDANSQYQQTNLVDGQGYQNDEDNSDDVQQENTSHHQQERDLNQSHVKQMEESDRDPYVTQQDEQNEFIDASKMEKDMTYNQSLEGAEIYKMLNQDTIVSKHQESKIQDQLHERELILAEYQQLNKEIQNLSVERKKFIKIQKKPFKVDYKRLVDISDDNEAIYRAKDLVRKMNAQRREKQQRERQQNERIDRYFASELIAEDNHRKLSYEQVKKQQIQERIDKYHKKQEEFQQLQQISHNFVKNLMQIGPQNGKLAQEVELRAQKVKGSNRMVKIDRLVVHLPRLKNLQQRKFDNEQVMLSYQNEMVKKYEQSKRSLFKK